LPQSDCDRIFYCEACADRTGIPRHDLEQLVECDHVPFFYRVALSVTVMQGLRKGEIVSQRWERIAPAGPRHSWNSVEWTQTPDWTGQVWLVETSWQDDTKNGQDRIQALIPMAARLLHRWWQYKGEPGTGLIFAASDAAPKRALGELAKYVARHPDLTNRDLLARAQADGFATNLHHIEVLRSEARARADRRYELRDRMFACGYDFGWTDTPYRDPVTRERRIKPGWVTKLGIENRRRFHDFRDTAATHLLSGTWGVRWDIRDVSEFIGHSDIKVTQERYASVTTDAKAQLAAGVQPLRPATAEDSKDSLDEILAAYPHARRDDIRAALEQILRQGKVSIEVSTDTRDVPQPNHAKSCSSGTRTRT
jgi:integrase